MDRTNADGNNGGLYEDRNTTLGREGTLIAARDKNLIQEELCNTVEQAGLTLDPNDDTQVFQAIQRMFLQSAVGNWFGVAHSTDPDDYTSGNSIISMASDGAGHIVAIGYSNSAPAVFISESSGAAWKTVTSGLSSATNIKNVLYANGNFYLFEGAGNADVWKSTDFGATWALNATLNPALLGGGFYVTLSTRPGACAYGGGRILLPGYRSDTFGAVVVYSDDDGATWDYFDISSDISASSIDVLSVAYTGTRFVLTYFADNTHVWYSSDGGENWTQSAAISGAVTSNPYHKVAAGGGAVMIKSGGKIFKSTDGGATFAASAVLDRSSVFGRFSDIIYAAGCWLVIGGGFFSPYTGSPEQIFYSFDNGASWKVAAVPEINTIYQACYAGGTFLACCNDGTNRILRTIKAF